MLNCIHSDPIEKKEECVYRPSQRRQSKSNPRERLFIWKARARSASSESPQSEQQALLERAPSRRSSEKQTLGPFVQLSRFKGGIGFIRRIHTPTPSIALPREQFVAPRAREKTRRVTDLARAREAETAQTELGSRWYFAAMLLTPARRRRHNIYSRVEGTRLTLYTGAFLSLLFYQQCVLWWIWVIWQDCG